MKRTFRKMLKMCGLLLFIVNITIPVHAMDDKALSDEELSEINAQLIHAAIKNKPDLIEQLIQVPGVNLDVKDNTGRTPLMHAASWGRDNIVRMLCEKKAKVNIPDNQGFTALMLAAMRNYPAVIKILAQHKVEANAKNDGGLTALMVAITTGSTQAIKELVEIDGINIDEQQDSDFTPRYTALAWAVINNKAEIVKLLLEKGANPDFEFQAFPGFPKLTTPKLEAKKPNIKKDL